MGTRVAGTGGSVKGIGDEEIGAVVVPDRGRSGRGPSVDEMGVDTNTDWIDAVIGEGVVGRTVIGGPEGSTGCVGIGVMVNGSGVVGESVVGMALGVPAAGDNVAAAEGASLVGRTTGVAVTAAATGRTVGRVIGAAVRSVTGAAVDAPTGAIVRDTTGDAVGRFTGAVVTAAIGAAVSGAAVTDAVARAVGDGVAGGKVASTTVMSTPWQDDHRAGHSRPLVLAATHWP